MITSKRPLSIAAVITSTMRGVWLETPRKRAFPCSRSRSKASWKVGASSRSRSLQAWMCTRST